MKLRAVVTICVVLLCACSPDKKPPLISPSGSMTLVSSIERSHRDPAVYLCVIFEIRDKSGKVLHTENTRASNTSRWSLKWVSDDRIRLDSSDIGTYYWNRQADGTWKKE